MSKICTVYHSIDLDGYMSAAIVKHWYETSRVEVQPGCYLHRKDKESLDFIGYNYGQPIPDLSEYDKVIMCDISFPKDIMRELRCDKFNFDTGEDGLIFIDHHASAIEDSKKEFYDNCAGLRDTKYAACELTWIYFFPNDPMPEIVRLLGMYDSFRHKGTNEEQKVLEFQYGARQCISNYEEAYNKLYDSLFVLPERELIDIIHTSGQAIYGYLCTEAKQTYKNGFEIQFYWAEDIGRNNGIPKQCSAKFICINKERFNPTNFGIDYHRDGYDGCACFHYANGMWNFSLYNDNGKVDCFQIAKQYGSGGHMGSAGFRLNNEKFLRLIG